MQDVRYDENGVPILSRTDIESRVENFLGIFAPRCLQEPRSTPVAEIAKILMEKHRLKLIFGAELGHRGIRKIRGIYDCATRTIAIDISLPLGEPRFNFTLAHEIGHFIMHRHLTPDMISRIGGGRIEDGDRDLMLDQLQANNPRTWIEWQANKFAASFLLPRKTVPLLIDRRQREMGISRNIGKLYVNRQASSYSDYRSVLDSLVLIFQVSAAAIKVRLRELNILEEASTVQSGPGLGPVHVTQPIGNVLDSWLKSWDSGSHDG